MALGKNLKKKQLIPSKTEENKKEKKVVAKKAEDTEKAPAKKKVAKSKKPAAKKKTPLKSSPTPKVDPAEVKAKQQHDFNLQEIKKRKKALNAKFEEEFKKIKGQKLHLIVFHLGKQEYALEIDRTREVVVTPEISEVPHMPHYVKGLVNIRENVIVALDLEKKYGLSKDEAVYRYIIVIKSKDYNVGILSREVPTTFIVEGERLSSPSGYMSDASIDINYIKGIVRDKDRLVYLIDIQELIEGDQVGILPESVSI